MSGRQHSAPLYIQTTENVEPNAVEKTCYFASVVLLIITFPISIFFCLLVVPEYKRAIIFRLGRLRKGSPHGPGILIILPCIDDCEGADLRTISYNVPAQEVLTRDSVTIGVDAVVYYRISNPLLAIIQVQNVHYATHLLAQTTLRNIAGTKFITELLAEKDTVSAAIAKLLDIATDPWGVKVERVEIKDVRLPELLQRAMAAEAEAAREAKAKVVSAEGELNASRALKEASDVMSTNPVALQLRYLQTLSNISGDQNHNIIFPCPVNLFNNLTGSNNGDSNGGSSGSNRDSKRDSNRDSTGSSNDKKNKGVTKGDASTQINTNGNVCVEEDGTTVKKEMDQALQKIDSVQFFDLDSMDDLSSEELIKSKKRRN